MRRIAYVVFVLLVAASPSAIQAQRPPAGTYAFAGAGVDTNVTQLATDLRFPIALPGIGTMTAGRITFSGTNARRYEIHWTIQPQTGLSEEQTNAGRVDGADGGNVFQLVGDNGSGSAYIHYQHGSFFLLMSDHVRIKLSPPAGSRSGNH